MSMKNGCIYMILLIFFTAVLAMHPLRIKAEESQTDRDVWDWTKKNLNPTWMEWGEKYWPTKPVRGGYFRRESKPLAGQ
jgi:hypothetical protein